MFAKGFATRNGIRPILILGAVLICGAFSELRASALGTVVVGAGTVDSGVGSIGRFDWNRTGGTFSNTLIPVPSHYKTFCIDTQGAYAGTYTMYDTILGLPSPTSKINNATDVARVVRLFEQNIQHVANPLTGLNANLGSLTQGQANAAFQAALWELLGINGGLSNFGTGAILTYATSMYNDAILNSAGYTENGAGNYFKLLGMSDGNGQDQIAAITKVQYLTELPVPAGAVLAGMGIVFVGGFNYLRRRKVVVA